MKRTCCLLIGVLLLASVGSSQIGNRDPVKEAQRKAEKEKSEKNYKELKEAAIELADLSKQMSDEIERGGEHVISARIFDRLGKIEKLAKRIKDRAKGW